MNNKEIMATIRAAKEMKIREEVAKLWIIYRRVDTYPASMQVSVLEDLIARIEVAHTVHQAPMTVASCLLFLEVKMEIARRRSSTVEDLLPEDAELFNGILRANLSPFVR